MADSVVPMSFSNRRDDDDADQVKLDGDVLLCPECKQINLHHVDVVVFNRDGGEDEPTIVTVVRDDRVFRDNTQIQRNPSSRRDGVAISFWCECCSWLGELTVSQHKGTTYLRWRRTGESFR